MGEIIPLPLSASWIFLACTAMNIVTEEIKRIKLCRIKSRLTILVNLQGKKILVNSLPEEKVEFDRTGRARVYVHYNEQGEEDQRGRYFYDAAGRRIRSEWHFPEKESDTRFEYRYNNTGHIIEHTGKTADGDVFNFTKYKYDAFGRESWSETIGGGGLIRLIKTKAYNTQGRLAEARITGPDG